MTHFLPVASYPCCGVWEEGNAGLETIMLLCVWYSGAYRRRKETF